MSLIVNGIDIDSLVFNNKELDKLIYNGVVVWEKGSPEVEAMLIDFDYIKKNGMYEITGWKYTLNGEPSTEMIIPKSDLIIVGVE